METTPNRTTVLCLFHTGQQAQEALAELQRSEVPQSSIEVINSQTGAVAEQALSGFGRLSLPEKDQRLLTSGISSGGTVVIVSGPESLTDKAEEIFKRHNSTKIDQKIIGDAAAPVAAVSNAGAVIPVIEEELAIGKRDVETGGVRVYSRIVETPVEETVTLREEHATVERRPVNRPVTEADVEGLRVKSIEVTETVEVPVVAKSARVVEEVLVGKEVSERTEVISDSVRKTQVEVETIGADVTTPQQKLER